MTILIAIGCGQKERMKEATRPSEIVNKMMGTNKSNRPDYAIKAPDFTLQSINDSTYTLRKMEDKVILINFWATWCGPCRMEIPEFNELRKKYHEIGFEILGISVDDSKKSLINFTKSFSIKYPLLYGSAKDMSKIMRDYGGVHAVPSSFLIGKDGSIIWSYPGAILKNYDPHTFTDLIYKIEKELKK